MEIIPIFPDFIATTTSAILLLIRVLDLMNDEDEIIPLFPAEPIAMAVLMLIQILSSAESIPLRIALRTILPTIPQHRVELWPRLERNAVQFWEFTGETSTSLTRVAQRISNDVQRYVRNPRNPRHRLRQTRPFALSVRDRILMLFIWLRTYPSFSNLGGLFGVSASTAAENVHIILMIALVHYENRYITWHSNQSWNTIRGSFDDFPNVVALIDATPIEINRPQGNLQRLYYRRDRGYHFINWQVIADCNGYFTYGQAGYMGHLTDAASYHMIHDIGYNCRLSLPRNAFVLADSGYPTGYPLLVPFSRRGGRRLTADMLLFNDVLSSYRIRVEHFIGDLKVYRCISGRYRHRRWRISGIANRVMALTNRRQRTIRDIRRRALRRL